VQLILAYLKKLKLMPLVIGLGFAVVVLTLNRQLPTLFPGAGIKRLLSPKAEVWFVLIDIVVTLVVWLIIFLRAHKASQKDEADLRAKTKMAAEEGPTGREGNLEDVHRKLIVTLDLLNASGLKTSRFQKASALYRVPWLLFLGTRQSAKSTVIAESGLTFPHAKGSAGHPDPDLPTRNCEFWLANEAVIVDASGRYLAGEEEELDQKEWREVMRLLKRYRRRRPVNGLVVAVGLDRIVNDSAEESVAMAKTLRQRIDTAMKITGVAFPVYIAFTKCDRLEGFSEFFAELKGEERDGVWGATFTWEQTKKQEPEAIFLHEFRQLHNALAARTGAKLFQAQGMEDRSAIYVLPLEFAGLQRKLTRFIASLFESNPYQQRPSFRGFYFASALQGDAPLAVASQAVSQAMGFTTLIGPAAGSRKPTAARNPFFIKDLFRKVFLPESAFARPTDEAATGSSKQTRVAAWVMGSVFGLLGLWGLFGYMQNHKLYAQVREAAVAAPQTPIPAVSTVTAPQFWERMERLNELREKILDVENRRSTPPVVMQRIIFRGASNVENAAGRVYLAGLRNTLLNPVGQTLEGVLRNPEQNKDVLFDSFNTYYSLQSDDVACLNRDDISTYVGDVWLPRAMGQIDGDRRALVLDQIKLACRRGHEWAPDGEGLVKGDRALINQAVPSVRANLTPRDRYQTLVRQISAKVPGYSLSDVPGGDRWLRSSDRVRGAYTRDGWEAFRQEMQAGSGGGETNCAAKLIFQGGGGFSPSQEMGDWYFEDYRKEWVRFLNGLDVKPFADLTQAQNGLGELSGPDSPLLAVLDEVPKRGLLKDDDQYRNAIDQVNRALYSVLAFVGDAGSLKNEDSGGVFGWIKNKAADVKQEVAGSAPKWDEYSTQKLGAIHAVVVDMGSAGSAGPAAFDGLKGLYGNGESPFKELDRWCSSFSILNRSDTGQALQRLLASPGLRAVSVMKGEAGAYLDQEWGTRVQQQFEAMLARGYPFAVGQDVLVSDFEAFFKPDGGILWGAYDELLAPFLSRRDINAPDRQGASMPFGPKFMEFLRRSDNITKALFLNGSLNLDFQVEPELYSMSYGNDPKVQKTTFELPGCDPIVSFMGRPTPKPVHWPGGSGEARVSIEVGTGSAPSPVTADGEWALFRLLDKADSTPDPRTGRPGYTWKLQLQGSYEVRVPYQFLVNRTNHPFAKDFFNGLSCPKRTGE